MYRACDPKQRAWFMNMPTSRVLAPQGVDRLHDAAGRLLRQSLEYETVVRDFGATLAK